MQQADEWVGGWWFGVEPLSCKAPQCSNHCPLLSTSSQATSPAPLPSLSSRPPHLDCSREKMRSRLLTARPCRCIEASQKAESTTISLVSASRAELRSRGSPLRSTGLWHTAAWHGGGGGGGYARRQTQASCRRLFAPRMPACEHGLCCHSTSRPGPTSTHAACLPARPARRCPK